jgi:hypothetical protein
MTRREDSLLPGSGLNYRHWCLLTALKSNLFTQGNAEIETAHNIRKREVSRQQPLAHSHGVIGRLFHQ